jgi:radical SAM superfamily enzyme YgiQ (UPF0313 family)
MIGFPEETKESIMDSINLLKELDVFSVALSIVIPYPFTKLFEQCKNDKLFVSTFNAESFWRGDISFFRLTGGSDEFIFKPYNMTISELEEYYQKLNAEVNKKNEAYIQQRKNAFLTD